VHLLIEVKKSLPRENWLTIQSSIIREGVAPDC